MSIPGREDLGNKLKYQYQKLHNFGYTPPALYELTKGIVDEILETVCLEIHELHKKIHQLEMKVNELEKKDKPINSR